MSQSARLAGHVVLVTGAAGTLGSAMCRAITDAGGTAIASDLATRADEGFITIDVTAEEDWRRAVDTIATRYGRLDGLVNNAGIAITGDVESTSYADWRRVQAINVDGVFLGCKYAMPLLAKSKAASIVTISSVSGIVGGHGVAAYNASKGAARLLSKSVALTGARRSPPIRSNSVHPSFVEGEMVDALARGSRDAERTLQRMRDQVPMRRLARPQEVAEAVVWLLSPASSFMTGAELVLDGGLVAG